MRKCKYNFLTGIYGDTSELWQANEEIILVNKP